MAFNHVVAVAAFVALFAVAAGDSTGAYFEGITFTSNVDGYANLTRDACDIQSLLSQGKYSDALALYQTGKYAFSSSGKKRNLANYATSNYAGEKFYDLLAAAHSNSSTWLDTLIVGAFNSSSAATAFSAILPVVFTKYFFHQVDAAYQRMVTKEAGANESISHDMDQAWAMYAAGYSGACTSPLKWAQGLAIEMGTTYEGKALTNLAITQAVADLQSSGKTMDSALLSSARDRLYHQVLLAYLQGLFREARAYDKCSKALQPTALAKAKVYWEVVSSLLGQYSGINAKALGTKIFKNFGYNVVKSSFNTATLTKLGFKITMIGDLTKCPLTMG